MKVVGEVKRVTDHAVFRFPVDDGYKRAMLFSIIGFSPHGVMGAYRTRKRQAHLWIIHPNTGQIRKRGLFESWFTYGRKARYLKRFQLAVSRILPVVWEWEVVL